MAMIDILENFRIVRAPDTQARGMVLCTHVLTVRQRDTLHHLLLTLYFQVPLGLNIGITMSAKNPYVRFESRKWDE